MAYPSKMNKKVNRQNWQRYSDLYLGNSLPSVPGALAKVNNEVDRQS